jgi:hypothetical protein
MTDIEKLLLSRCTEVIDGLCSVGIRLGGGNLAVDYSEQAWNDLQEIGEPSCPNT